ncbi:hypothetical protein PG991_008275 [Apiospora marii]|uniref:NACHT domain-containing protein n=1 Tax=Apiospora marii TaxID=335849 RepID=A0ABR1RQG1_9PEZI
MESQKDRAAEPLQHNDYTVGWVSALPKEQTAATAMLDERHKDRELHLRKQPNDTNTYTLGSIGGHNIVIACLPKGKFGTISAATVAAHMIHTFPAIRFGLMVGIGGAVSRKVRLGDVVVGTPSGPHPGVVQWDMGKAGDFFERTGSLNNPPNVLVTALTKLETDHNTEGSKVPEYLKAVGDRNSRLRAKYEKSDLVDRLFKASYGHSNESHETDEDEMEDENENDGCRHCDPDQTIKRKPRDMMVHYGTIASGNQVIKNAKLRDQLSKDLGGNVLCVEMEAAGLMDNFPCIVIRGICDYADSHKNDAWQEHAAAVAAAFAKECLGYIQASEVEGERTVQEALQTVCNGISTIKDDTTHTRAMLSSEADLKVLNWLTPMNYGPQHSDYLRRRQPGTGQWFLRSNKYKQWLSEPGQTLFCHGMPGAGKTILASIIISDLEQKFLDSNSATVAYIYLSFQQKDEQNIEGLMSSLLKQITQTRPSLPEAVANLYRKHASKQTKPMLGEILDALRLAMAEDSKTFVIIDALDEYHPLASSRGRFLLILSDLQDKTRMNLLTTARPIPDIRLHFNETRSSHLEVRASEDDIRTYLRSNVWQLGSCITKESWLMDLVIEKMQNPCKEYELTVMFRFLLAQIYLKFLEDKDTPNDVCEALDRMSDRPLSTESPYQKAYDDMMTRITGQLPGHAKRAKQVLGWIVHAERPLKTHELQHALGVKFGQSSVDPKNLPETDHLVSICAGLVTVDKGINVIRLIHYTVQEYFVSTKNQWFPEFQETMAMTCISYLSFEAFATGRCHHSALEKRFQEYPFYDYAAGHWGHHARGAQTRQYVLKFLQADNEVEAADQARDRDQSWMSCPMVKQAKSSRDARVIIGEAVLVRTGRVCNAEPHVSKRNGLHLAAAFGLESAVREMLRAYDVNSRDMRRTTALELAASNNYPDTVRVLVEKGADLVSQKMALYEASGRGYLEVVRCLTDNDGPSRSNPGTMANALSRAVSREICELLVERGADVDFKHSRADLDFLYNPRSSREASARGITPLHCAIESRNLGQAQRLIEKGASVHATDSLGRTPLLVAMHIKSGFSVKEKLVQLLLEHGADGNVQDDDGRTAMDMLRDVREDRERQLKARHQRRERRRHEEGLKEDA